MTRPLRAALTTAAVSTLALGAAFGPVLGTIAPAAAASSSSSSSSSSAAASAGAAAGPLTIDTSTAALASSTLVQSQRYILEFSPTTDAVAEAEVHAGRGMAVRSVLTDVFAGEIADLSASQVRALRLNPRVRTIEADTPVQVDAVQSPATWGLDRIDQRVNAPSNSYGYDTMGAGVKAYVVDTGILATHSDFGGRVTSGTNAYSGVSDGRGSSDCDGHGTHVAGIIGGTIYGVAKGVTLVPVRVLDCTGGGTASGIINGLNWIAGNHPSGAPAVANLSLGLSANTLVDRAVKSVIDDGVSVAVAAGNENKDACTRSPSRVPEAVTVGATDSSDRRPYWSNYGTCVDLFAPGASITSDWKDGTTSVLSGTSMATPHVVGAMALLLGVTPTRSPADIAADLKALATTGMVLDGGTRSPNLLLHTGYTPPPVTEPPAAPGSVSASTPSGGSTTVSWTPTTSPSVIDQTVNAYSNGTLAKATVVSASASSLTFGPLTPGASYTFTVQARNSIGSSTASVASSAVVWRTTPSMPTSVTATLNPDATASVSWSVASDGGSALTEQVVRTYKGSDLVATTSVSGSATGYTTPAPLELGATYRFTVQARNSIGLGTVSGYSNSLVIARAPGAATSVVAALRATSNAKITWTPGSNGGSALTRQVVRAYADGVYLKSFDVSGTAKSLTLTGVSIGVSYTFTVQAVNLIGTGAESTASNAILRVR